MSRNCKINSVYFFLLFAFICFIFINYILFSNIQNLEKYTDNYTLSIFVNNELVHDFPSRDSGYTLTGESSCNNGVELVFDDVTWTLKVNYDHFDLDGNTRTQCNLYFALPYKESILNESVPFITEEMVPVDIDNNGVVRRADITKEWYSYEKQKWANVVLLKDKNINYPINAIISENNIESYFVWIPKYRYQLWDLGNYSGITEIDASKIREISVIFGDYNTSDSVNGECTTPMTSGSTGNCNVKDYMTHPAFLSIPSTGFWAGKFETSNGNNLENNSINPSGVQIKPNVTAWRNIQIKNAFYTSFDYRRDLDSHMMKNTEWGAIAYLQHSNYGSKSSVRNNNNSNYITGFSAVKEPTCGYTNDNRECNSYGLDENITKPYNTSIGVLASTTGNISGIYDMAGGSWEYMMAVMVDKNGNPMSGRNSKFNSGFNGTFGCPTCDNDTSNLTSLTSGIPFPNTKYYDLYLYAENDKTFNRRILGDATGEMGPFGTATYATSSRQIGSWYQDEAWFTSHWLPFVSRSSGFSRGNGTGIFTLTNGYGHASEDVGFRIVLTPSKK